MMSADDALVWKSALSVGSPSGTEDGCRDVGGADRRVRP